MNNDNTDNYPMFVIYGILGNTSETRRWYVTARTAEVALTTFWSINARDLSSDNTEWIIETFVFSSDTNPA